MVVENTPPDPHDVRPSTGRSARPACRRTVVQLAPHRRSHDPVVAELREMLTGPEPMAFVQLASRSLVTYGADAADIVAMLRRSPRWELAAFGVALAWLDGQPAPVEGIRHGLPAWLERLDATRITRATRRALGPDGSLTSYLMEAEFANGRIGTIHARVDSVLDGAVTNVFASDEPLETVQVLLRPMSEGGQRSATRVRSILPSTAIRAIEAGLERYDAAGIEPEPFSPWPGTRPLVEFAIRRFDGTPARRGSAA